jgi:hypothetical protein
MGRFLDHLRRTPLAGPLADVVSFVNDPRAYLLVISDYLASRKAATFLRTLPPPSVSAPNLLILSMTDSVYNAKVESMLALALRRRGWKVCVLTSNIYTRAKRIFRAFGITQFVAFEELVARAGGAAAARAEVRRRRNDPTDFQSVIEWVYGDAWIGPQLLSSISRRRFDGAPDPRDPETRRQLFDQLLQSVKFVHAAERYLDESRPDMILVNEPNYHVLGPFVDTAIARGIPTIHFSQPSREDGLILKKLTAETRRIHPNSITLDTLDLLARKSWTDTQQAELDREFEKRYSGFWRMQERNQPGTVEKSASEIARELRLDESKPTAALFSHVLWDANLFFGKDIFDNYGDWFLQTVEAAVANPRLNWLIKLHPANIWKRKLSGATNEYGELRLIRERIGELPAHVRILPPDTPISTLSLFKTIDVGITVRGSIGYELPCFGVPVVTAGTGRYSGFGFTEDHASRASYLDMLGHLENVRRLDASRIHRARVHAHALFVQRPWVYHSFKSVIGSDVSNPLFQNVSLAVAANQQITDNGDLDRFADWAIEPGTLDYLAAARC